MKILKSSQIREVDSYTIKNEPIKSIDLMERAARTISEWITNNINEERAIKIFAGPGNNGGDGLAIARQLALKKYRVKVYILKITDKFSNDCQINFERLKEIKGISVNDINNSNDFPEVSSNDVIIDGLFGSGLTRKLEGLAKELVVYLNLTGAEIIAIDIPSGLFGENNDENDSDSVTKAKTTLSFQMPKLAFMFSDNNKNVGDWKVLPIGLNKEFINQQESNYYLIGLDYVKKILKKREKFSHKGTFGHILMVSGSYGKMGAAILSAKAALRTGSGLVTTHIPKIGYQIMQTALPEAMISIDWSDVIVTSVPDVENYTAIGVGPGIGAKKNTQKALDELLSNVSSPIVVDADGLNIISENKDLINKIPENSILTPHPKEFERLVGKFDKNFERLQKQIEFAVNNKVYVLLKGAHSAVACPDGEVYFNSTGNPGMATAGSGDVLSGVILSLLGQGYNPKDAVILGVYLHGLAADLAVRNSGEEALIASDIIDNIGNAYIKIRTDEN